MFQIAASGVPLNKIVIGKPATAADANNGYIAPATLATCVEQAKSQGWSECVDNALLPKLTCRYSSGAGVMTWQVSISPAYRSVH